MTVRKFLLLVLLFGLTSCLGLTGCSVMAAQVGIPWTSSIAQVRSNPPIGWSVYLQGTVVKIAPMIDQQMYELKDDSGDVWVLTKTAVQQGKTVKIRGTVRFESIPINGQEQGEVYIEERNRL